MKTKVLNVLCFLFGLMMINAGLNKIFEYIPMPADMPEHMLKMYAAFKTIGWLLPLVAVVEVIGGILFMIPRTRAFGAIVVFPPVVGILLTHIFQAPEGLPIAIVLLIINVIVVFENKEKFLALLKK
jgi:uncharacterized membrane protein YphA (DoxX/SURF4 family)